MLRITILLLAGIIGLSACSKTVCLDPNDACNDTPPAGDVCTAYFQTWFYNSNTNTCELIGYSGCGPKGFETEAACNNDCKNAKQ